jgi:hypothetical protein
VIPWEGMPRIRLVVMAGCLDRSGLFGCRGYGEDPVGVPGAGSQGRNR